MPSIATQTTTFLPKCVPVLQKKVLTARWFKRMTNIFVKANKKVSKVEKQIKIVAKKSASSEKASDLFLAQMASLAIYNVKQAALEQKEAKKGDLIDKKAAQEIRRVEIELKKAANEIQKAEKADKKAAQIDKKAAQEIQKAEAELKKAEKADKKAEKADKKAAQEIQKAEAELKKAEKKAANAEKKAAKEQNKEQDKRVAIELKEVEKDLKEISKGIKKADKKLKKANKEFSNELNNRADIAV